MKKLILLGFSIVAFSAAISDVNLGLRKHDLFDENKLNVSNFNYPSAPAGEAERFDRAYFNAPPQIPHDVSEFLPITQDNNSCLGCHDQGPDAANEQKGKLSKEDPTPIPASHYYDLRSDKQLNEVSSARYNCVQCHAPQAQIEPKVSNSFKPDFRGDKDAKYRSNLLDVINEGVK